MRFKTRTYVPGQHKTKSFTFPPDFITDLEYVAKQHGCTQSWLISDLLADPMRIIAAQLRELNEHPHDRDQVARRQHKALQDDVRIISDEIEKVKTLMTLGMNGGGPGGMND